MKRKFKMAFLGVSILVLLISINYFKNVIVLQTQMDNVSLESNVTIENKQDAMKTIIESTFKENQLDQAALEKVMDLDTDALSGTDYFISQGDWAVVNYETSKDFNIAWDTKATEGSIIELVIVDRNHQVIYEKTGLNESLRETITLPAGLHIIYVNAVTSGKIEYFVRFRENKLFK